MQMQSVQINTFVNPKLIDFSNHKVTQSYLISIEIQTLPVVTLNYKSLNLWFNSIYEMIIHWVEQLGSQLDVKISPSYFSLAANGQFYGIFSFSTNIYSTGSHE